MSEEETATKEQTATGEETETEEETVTGGHPRRRARPGPVGRTDGRLLGGRPLGSRSPASRSLGDRPLGGAPFGVGLLADRAVPGWMPRLVMAGLVMTALNLRPAITSLGALMEEVRHGLHMSGTAAGMLTSVPALCFAVFGVTAPRLARRYGPVTVVGAGMAAIAVGLAVRSLVGTTAAFVAVSALALAGIAMGNVLVPVIIKRYFPERVGAMTGLYSMALALGTSSAAAVTVPLTQALGGSWRAGLGVWAVLAALAVLPWLPVVLRDRGSGGRGERAAGRVPRQSRGGSRGRNEGAAAAGTDAPMRITRSRTAWALGVFFGLQATGAYITMGWLPQIFHDAGIPAGQAGVLLAVTMGVGVPLSFVLPALAARYRHQGPFAAALGLFGITGYLGLALAPAAAPWVWSLLLGVSNCAFPLALTMVGLRSRSTAGVVKLSAFAQGVGYLISIPGPIAVGALYEHSGGWSLPITLIAGLLVPQIVVGILAGRVRHIEDEV
ncbi:CynX/NimT family MFS transporter [Wenjunlia tyrosinilytica]|uniref:MFS transporter n=1 Tax=Wenjunlia tyrosinilytica TaxID=1544741 RepID=A0A917ZD79_9ACTN|nr:MFS transporter [Wenjunlia tyrosinilytica]GGO81170.1 MFS transporter [Wenjunlia tyrosinilytica]